MDLFLCTHNQVAMWQHALQMLAHASVGNKPLLAVTQAGQAPQHRSVVNIDHDFGAGSASVLDRLHAGIERLLCGEMRTGNDKRLGGANKVSREVRTVDRHIGAVGPVEDQREGLAVFDTEYHHAGQALLIGNHVAGVDTIACQLFTDKPAHMLVANACQHGGFQPEACGARGDIA